MSISQIAYYVDANSNFLVNNGDLLLLNMDALKNQIDNIINTTPGDRFGDYDDEPEFGSDVGKLLFDPIDDITAWKIETALYRAIGRWLGSRIQLDYSNSSVQADIKNQCYIVVLSYKVLLTNINTFYKVTLTR
jgi:phage baseplate assembly protein W